MEQLEFSDKANTKVAKLCEALGILPEEATQFSLPAGYTCAAAKMCKSLADEETGYLTDYGYFRCYAAMTEAYAPGYRSRVWRNYRTLQRVGLHNWPVITQLIVDGVRPWKKVVRMMGGGDFPTEAVLMSFVSAAIKRPGIRWYGYTKNLPWLLSTRPDWPDNFRLVYSHGGLWDMNADFEVDLPTAYVVLRENDRPDLPLDADDILAYEGKQSFKLLIHGCQPPHINKLTC